jgi:hypothetical protein
MVRVLVPAPLLLKLTDDALAVIAAELALAANVIDPA